MTDRNGMVHRGSATKCDPTIEMTACQGDESRFFCKTDDDCKDGPHAKCVHGVGQIGTYCGCTYSCVDDAECGEGKACVCKGLGTLGAAHSVCAKAACKTDEDCGGSTCGLSTYHNGCSEQVMLACHSREDKCKSTQECRALNGRSSCAVKEGREGEKPVWQCTTPSCVIGRPLVVEGSARSSSPRERGDWLVDVQVEAKDVEETARAAIVSYYAEVAAMEHASVASFARFSLELLALGAPSELVVDAHRAALDEVEHARIAYSIASAFAARQIGPDKLLFATAPFATTISAFVEALVLEGCVGETLGAAEGRELSRGVESEALRALLSHIAADEERHAALAWRTLKWALTAFGEEAKNAALLGFAKAEDLYAHDPVAGFSLPAYGLVGKLELGALRRETLAFVVAPCRDALDLGKRACS